jgi:hypothetical protein
MRELSMEMNPKIDRRQFLISLAGLGAAIALPLHPTTAQINAEWRRLAEDPWYFVVGEYGTIVEPDEQEPKINSDIYQIGLDWPKTPKNVVDEIDRYDELTSRFVGLAANALEGVEDELQEEGLVPERREYLEMIKAILQDEEEGWREWVLAEGKVKLPMFKEAIKGWLDEPVDWSQLEVWPRGWSSQGRALSFFQGMDATLVNELGVVIIEGEHPSRYRPPPSVYFPTLAVLRMFVASLAIQFIPHIFPNFSGIVGNILKQLGTHNAAMYRSNALFVKHYGATWDRME